MWQRFGSLGTVAEFWRVFSEVNPDNIREEAERPYRILLLGAGGSGKTTLARALSGGEASRVQAGDVLVELDYPLPALPAPGDGSATAGVPAASLPVPAGTPDTSWLPRADLYVYLIDAGPGVTATDRGAIQALRQGGRPIAVLVNKCDLAGNLPELQYNTYAALGDVPADRIGFGAASRGHDVETVVARLLLTALPGLRLALARRLPALRAAVGDDLIMETSRVNAEFALLSNLPANIPVVGGLLGGGADFLVLTKNQAMMLFKLAAIHGRKLDSKLTLAAEVTPVVGAAFLWRSVAREIIGMLPTFVAAVPKTAIGYVGTYVVGKTAQYYYAIGSRPTREMVQRFTEEATRRWRTITTRSTQLLPGEHWPTKRDLEG